MDARSLAIALCALLCCGLAIGQSFPVKPITVLVPFPPGASADNTMRMVGQRFSDAVGQPVIVESRPAGAGTAAAMAIKQAPPDGYLLMQINIGSHAVNPLLSRLPYDPVRDFQPISVLWTFPSVLAVPAASPAKSVAELVALARSKPGGLSFASQGMGSGGHILGELFKSKTGAPMVHVPYKGAAPALVDLVAGRADLLFASYGSVGPQVRDGKLRMLAVASPARLKALPDLPMLAELGVPGVDFDAWFGLAAPAATPVPVVQRLANEFTRAARAPELVRQMAEQGIEITTTTPAEFAALISSDMARLSRLIIDAGIKAD